jgi:uncharacterized protein
MLGRFFKSGPGVLLLIPVVLVLGAGAIVGYQIREVTHPPRQTDQLHPGDFLLRADDIAFQSTDGVPLAGWLIHGEREAPAIILCHDLGESKSVFLDAVVPLQRAGYNLFLFDFRGHGSSGGQGSTLGSRERYDVLGAIDLLRARSDIDSTRLGIWGVGMGAYAAVLAAKERKEVVALALDSVYPDVGAYLDRALFKGVPRSASKVTGYASLFYGPYFQWKVRRGEVAEVLPRLSDRNLLFVAGKSHPASVEEARQLYISVPETGQADKNLLLLGSSGVASLYAGDKMKYEEAISGFFGVYLRVHAEERLPAIRLKDR